MPDSKEKKQGLRIHDIADGLKDVTPSGPISEFSTTLLLGKAASLALHMKGQDVITNMPAFKYAVGELGIGLELESVLRELEELDFIRRPSKNKIEVKVPIFVDAYKTIGQRWEQSDPTEIERKAVEILSRIENNPVASDIITSDFSLNPNEKRIIYEVGGSGAYLEQFFLSDGTPVTYSPALTEFHQEKLFAFSQKHSEHALSQIIHEVRSFQGIPLEKVSSQLIREACVSGVLLRTSVNLNSSRQDYIFAPIERILPENKVILDKARAILTCVRCGEHHTPASTSIDNAYLILNAMKSRKRLRRHPAHPVQYGLIISKGIARLSSPSEAVSELEIIDTEENLNAIQLALEMIGLPGTTRTAATQMDAKNAIVNPDGYHSPSSSRVRYKKEYKKSPETAKEIVKTISQLQMGVYDVFK